MDDVQVTRASEIERLYRGMGDRLWWAVFAYSGDREIASDATAESFARHAPGSGASEALACPPDQRESFGGPRLRLDPGGSQFITVNTPGIEAADAVVQATVEHQWSGSGT